MVKIKLKSALKSFVKGNLLMTFSALGFTSFLSLIVLMALGVTYYFVMNESWALYVFAVITVGFVVLCVIHYLSIPILAKNDEYFGGLQYLEIMVIEDIGLQVDGYNEKGEYVRGFTIYWDDINKVTYAKEFYAIQFYGNEMLLVDKNNAEYLEGNAKTFEYHLRNNIDRRPIKSKRFRKIVK